MKLSDVKDKIDEYFDSHTEEEVLEALERHRAIETKDNMEEKELDLCELLRDYKGEKIYVLSHGYMTVMGGLIGTIELDGTGEHGETLNLVLNYDGTHIKGTEVIAFPSRALYEKYPLDAKKAWDEWAESRKPKYSLEIKFYPFKDGKMLMSESEEFELQVHSLEEAQQAAEAVRECLEKFHKDHTEK